jgi:hypothetical protein
MQREPSRGRDRQGEREAETEKRTHQDRQDIKHNGQHLPPVPQHIRDIPQRNVVRLGTDDRAALGVVLGHLLRVGLVALHAAHGMLPLGRRQEPGRGRVARQQRPAHERHEDRQPALEQVDDLPAVQPAVLDVVHEPVGDEPGKGARQRVGAAEEAHAQAHAVLGVERAQQVEARGREARLGGAQQQAQGDERAAVADARVRHAQRAPDQQHAAEPPARAQLARRQRRQRLQRHVRRAEEREAVGDVVGLQVRVLDEAARRHEAHVGLVDAAQHEADAQDHQHHAVQLAVHALVQRPLLVRRRHVVAHHDALSLGVVRLELPVIVREDCFDPHGCCCWLSVSLSACMPGFLTSRALCSRGWSERF